MTLQSEHSGRGPRLVLLHGFTQTARCWGPVLGNLTRDHEVVRVDAPGHGGSSFVRARLAEAAGLVADVGGPAVYLGYSMGARLALHVALDRPDVVQGLVLVGGTAGIESEAERGERCARDEALARRIRAEGVDRFLDWWLGQPLFAGLPDWARFDQERRRNIADGLASSLELAGTGAQQSRWAELGAIDCPVLVVAGADDVRYAAIAQRMADAIGSNATVALVQHAGHAAHLEEPERFLGQLHGWFDSNRGALWRGNGRDATS